MKKLILKRIAHAAVTLLLISMLLFAATTLLPGDVAIAMLGQSASDDTLAAMRQSLGLDITAPVRYWHWLMQLLHGDLGLSLANRQPVAAELWTRLGNTFYLAGLAAAIAVPLSLLAGVVTAVWRNGWLDRLSNMAGLLAISLPEFFIAYLLILWLSVDLELFPSLSAITPDMPLATRLQAMALPALTLILAVFAYIMRMTRTAILNTLREPYIEMAILKGTPRWRLILRHALPNALAPIIQVIAFNLAYMVVGIVLVEVVFVYPGIGQYLVNAVAKRDVTVVQACGLVFALTYISLNLIADVLVVYVNPRLRQPR